MTKLIGHLRNHAVGYIGFVTVTLGVSYVAISPPTSRAQVQDHRTQTAKIDSQVINGAVRAWAIIGPNGHVIASGGKPKVTPQAGDPGGYGIRWGAKVGRCATTVTIDQGASPPTERIPVSGDPSAPFTAGYAVAATFARHNETAVQTYNQQGEPTPLGFDVTVVC